MDFLNWLIPARHKETFIYKQVADLIASKVPIESTLDAYGEGAGPHGSAYKAAGNQVEKIAGVLVENGFSRKGNNLVKANVKVELGKDKKETFLYITDDN